MPRQVNKLTSDVPTSAAAAMRVIDECHASWKTLKSRGPGDTGFWLG